MCAPYNSRCCVLLSYRTSIPRYISFTSLHSLPFPCTLSFPSFLLSFEMPIPHRLSSTNTSLKASTSASSPVQKLPGKNPALQNEQSTLVQSIISQSVSREEYVSPHIYHQPFTYASCSYHFFTRRITIQRSYIVFS